MKHEMKERSREGGGGLFFIIFFPSHVVPVRVYHRLRLLILLWILFRQGRTNIHSHDDSWGLFQRCSLVGGKVGKIQLQQQQQQQQQQEWRQRDFWRVYFSFTLTAGKWCAIDAGRYGAILPHRSPLHLRRSDAMLGNIPPDSTGDWGFFCCFACVSEKTDPASHLPLSSRSFVSVLYCGALLSIKNESGSLYLCWLLNLFEAWRLWVAADRI